MFNLKELSDMETKINIAKILNDKPEGTKLWTDMFGIVTLYVVTDACDAFQVKHHNKEPWFDEDGKLYKEGVLCIYPSKSMRNWSKFAWKKGDVLVSKDGNAHVIFEGFDDDTYETFNGNNYLWKNEGITMCFGEYEDELPTSDFSKANQEDAQKYIHQIEKRLGYKLNFETLKIEKYPEFKNGDIVVCKCKTDVPSTIFIFRGKDQLAPYYSYYACLEADGYLCYRLGEFGIYNRELRLATEEEKKQLFSALKKEGKLWDSDKKSIVDLKPKWTLKPFDRVITRNDEDDIWTANIFSHMDSHGEYVTIGCIAGYPYCLPYNEETAHLLGTADDWEGGEQ